ncbi:MULTISPECIES: alpha/beta hydrolase [Leuconostoc]|uniref:Alpha/beta hydrolase superfamily protein n=2 Tax=Leuconostoc gelidum group TaxID=3016637 RepID=A0ABP2B321_9LACO|nr:MULTISPECIES: alpha/beta hydrolase [Leuconostoc]MBR2276345.1 alpha/beta hydrolase [Leuconostoc sp.]MBZ5943475.1 alpha/beta hydrolase [Leuconostoc gasicomitatum]MBZ5948458.1 alpha/beta hydrolase [Leuconostoc gasicomitatum]MBZ5954334.1 alpha/beta hydrolase [Leuconostoc gasicomitatum]MBZ5958041.1 alpha/beta hydrolase [Leuconostoc gasicomitatum]
MKNRIVLTLILILSLILMVFLGIYGQHWVSETSTHQSKIKNSHMTPVIFVPGSEATVNRFDHLLSEINASGPTHSVLKVKVNQDGELIYTGKINANDRQPFIVIGFQNNEDGYNNIKKQTQWLTSALYALQDRYHFQTFSAVGHSNGGLIWTNFFENYFDSDDFSIPTLMTLGTPFNFSETSLQRRTEMLKDFIQDNSKIPSHLTVYSIAGTEDYTDDGIVPIQSVIAGKYIYQKRVKSYTQITVTGDNAQHSNLPDNPEVMKLIQSNIITPLSRRDRH